MMKSFLAAGVGALLAMPASAAVVSLNFENIAPYPNNNNVRILDYYNGGTSSIGTSGTNYGVSFGENALLICLNTPGVSCSNTSRGGSGAGSERGSLFFLEGSETFLNFADGFTTGFSFNYVSVSFSGSVGVYDGLNGTGNLLASIGLSPNADVGSCFAGSGSFCPFGPAGVSFDGTARSISFGGVANQIVFDDITFGSSTPGSVVPEPATWAMMILGFGAIGMAMRRRRGLATVSA